MTYDAFGGFSIEAEMFVKGIKIQTNFLSDHVKNKFDGTDLNNLLLAAGIETKVKEN